MHGADDYYPDWVRFIVRVGFPIVFWFTILLLFCGCDRPPAPKVEVPAPSPTVLKPLARCQAVVTDVRIQHFKYFGTNFPYWYGVAQLEVESNCREEAIAFDGGQGIAQFMPATADWVCSLLGEPLNPFNHDDAIRMQAFYMGKLHVQNPVGRLWLSYQAYNGGWGTLLKEYRAAGSASWELMRSKCQRRVIILKNGCTLDLCEVNYGYSKKISKFAEKYRLFSDDMRFW